MTITLKNANLHIYENSLCASGTDIEGGLVTIEQAIGEARMAVINVNEDTVSLEICWDTSNEGVKK